MRITRQRKPSALKSQEHATTIDIEGQSVPLKLVRNPRARRLIVKIDHVSRGVTVVAPTQNALKEALALAEKERRWIADALAKIPPNQPFIDDAHVPLRGQSHKIIHASEARRGVWIEEMSDMFEMPRIIVSGDQAFVPRRVEDWLKREARRDLMENVDRFTNMLELPLPKISVRDASTRWGSCTSEGRLSFSWRLIFAPANVLSYVAAHEVAHLKHLNHSKRFWSVVRQLVGPYADEERWLNEEGMTLHRYGGPASVN